MKWLYLTAAHHQHARQVGRSLLEDNALGRWLSGPLLCERGAFYEKLPGIRNRILSREFSGKIHAANVWEGLRAVAARFSLSASWEDHLWERGEWALDGRGSKLLSQGMDGVIGFEHGCLETLKESKRLEKPSIVVFASVHHVTRKEYLKEAESRWPEWVTPQQGVLVRRGEARDARRDRELEIAGMVLANSDVTRDSLRSAGVSNSKIKTIPLGLPEAKPAESESPNQRLRVIFAGNVSLQKGVPYLLEAVTGLPTASMELELYGRVMTQRIPSHPFIRVHGSVSRERLEDAFRRADVLVFPSLCDGFGQVVGEALAYGLPVICSEHAGAVQFIEDGKNGFRVPAADAGAIKNSLQWCLDHRKELAALRESARLSYRKWNWTDFRRATREALHAI